MCDNFDNSCNFLERGRGKVRRRLASESDTMARCWKCGDEVEKYRERTLLLREKLMPLGTEIAPPLPMAATAADVDAKTADSSPLTSPPSESN